MYYVAQNASWSDYLPRPIEDKEGWRLHWEWFIDIQLVDFGWKKKMYFDKKQLLFPRKVWRLY